MLESDAPQLASYTFFVTLKKDSRFYIIIGS